MPAKSEAQRRFMAGCAKNPGKMHARCPDKKTAREFAHKPKGGYPKKTPRKA